MGLPGRNRVPALLPQVLIWVAFPSVTASDGVVTREEALAAIFPGAQIRSEIVILTEEQRKTAEALSGAEFETSLIARYTALKDGSVLGRAYVDTHFVRAKKESLLIVVDASGVLLRVEVTAFLDDPEHKAPEAFYRQYQGKSLGDDLYVDRAIRPVAGATLTVRATNKAVRRMLAVDKILNRRE